MNPRDLAFAALEFSKDAGPGSVREILAIERAFGVDIRPALDAA